MSAPQFIPQQPLDRPRHYVSPPRRAGSWLADRPGDLVGGQPSGARLGSQGPDQGFVYRLMDKVKGRIVLGPGEHLEDVTAGCAAVALKRASLFGRAPVIHDVEVACTIFGFFSTGLGAADASVRSERFAAVHHPHHYEKLRALVDGVPEEALRITVEQARNQYGSGALRVLN